MTDQTISQSTKKLLAYKSLKGVGPAKLRSLISLRDLETLSFGSSEPTGVAAIDKAINVPGAWLQAQEHAIAQIEAARIAETKIISVFDSSYPMRLSHSPDNPYILFVRGRLSSQEQPTVAVIGTRQPTRHGVITATRITRFLVDNEYSIVSGLAIGCDSVAHQEALRAGGHAVAVLAHGLQTIAPASNRALADEIVAKGGALVSEYEFGTQARPPQFVRRDLIQAGLSEGVVIVQSGLDGGSLHATRAAIKYGRWLAVPSPTKGDRQSESPKIGANLLLSDGKASEQVALLRCKQGDLNLIRLLYGKEDYEKMLSPVVRTPILC